MNKYELIRNDQEIIDLYNLVTEYEIENKGWAHHNLSHILNVVDLVESLLASLKYDELFIEEAKIAALLHDVGCVEGKENHPERSYLFAKDYFKRKNIKLTYEESILDAIKNHSNGFETDNIMRLVLILSDKLDVKSSRITEIGKTIIGNRQFSHIKDINILIEDNTLLINFISDNALDIKELEEYYFLNKINNAIKAFSKKLDINYKVFLNNEIWKIFK